MNPTMSVVIPVRNGARTLARALASIAAQTHPPHEIVLVDGHSTDATAQIAQQTPGVRYLSQQSPGLAAAFNEGIAAAQGELIAFLSHDDWWEPHKLARQVAHLQAQPTLQYTVTHVHFFVEAGFALPLGFRPALLHTTPPAFIPETLLARRAVFQTVGLFDPRLTHALDVDWFARAFDAQLPHAIVPEALLHKGLHDGNMSQHIIQNNQNLLLSVRRSLTRKHATTGSDA